MQAICDAVDELCAEGPGDILVFLSGEREIRDTADALRRGNRRDLEILPLFARLSAAEQHRVFQSHPGRRVVLATNVAETSLTVPGIRYVVDPGTARISRYSQRLKVQRLPIEPVSQASANQRKGRCGRTADGICIRLYSEADFEARPEFTDPEILRTNLASVILQMAALDLGDVAAFPFVEPPDRRGGQRRRRPAAGARRHPHRAGRARRGAGPGRAAVDRHRPAAGRAAGRPAPGPDGARGGGQRLRARGPGASRRHCPSRTPASARWSGRRRPRSCTPASATPSPTSSPCSTCGTTCTERQRELSSNQFRKLCRTEFLNYLRVREWQDLESQLREVARSLGISRNAEPAEPTKIHVSVLAGLLSHIGLRDVEKPEYIGARGARFVVFAGLGPVPQEHPLGHGRRAGRDDPALGPGGRPDRARVGRAAGRAPGQAQLQRAALGGQRGRASWRPRRSPCTACRWSPARKVHYGRIDPTLSRELFIRHALVEGDWRTQHAFFRENRALLDEVEELEHRARRRDILVDDETLFAFYDARIGAEVVSGRHFDSWWKRIRRTDPDLLNFVRQRCWSTSGRPGVDPAALPGQLAPGRPRTAADLPVRAGSRRRRRHRPHSTRPAQPGSDRRRSTGRSRACGPTS